MPDVLRGDRKGRGIDEGQSAARINRAIKMFEFHDDRHANMVLNLVDRESRSVAQGLERRVLEFKWSFHQLPAHTLAPAVGRLCLDGLLFSIGNVLRLTPRGYGLLTAPGIRENAETFLAGMRESGPPSEFGIRNRILSVFAHHGMKAGDRLGRDEINRFWQVAHYRASQLQDGLELLLRDGAIKMARLLKAYIRLEKDGERYMNGRATPDWLFRHSPKLEEGNLKRRTVSDRTLRMMVAHQFGEARDTRSVSPEELDYLLERHELPAFARFHAIDLAWRLGDVDTVDAVGLRITDQGRSLQAELQGRMAQTLVQMEVERMKNP